MPLSPLPIDDQLPHIVAALRTKACGVILAPTGAGKTTRVPPALLDARLAADKQIVMLEPRRLAARAAAARMSAERGTRLGDEVGYEVRFDRRSSGRTRILCVTDGVFVRMLADDPFLDRVGIVLFDEFHERSLNGDLALAMLRHVQREVRPDLKIVVMSATLAAEPIAKYLDDCPIVESFGRLFPVEIEFAAGDSLAPIHVQAAEATANILNRTAGDVLVFLPGVGEIRRIGETLGDLAGRGNMTVMELYGDLPLERQQAVLAPADRRKIVLATNVAQTSVTIEGVTGVVDTGWARVLRRDPSLGIDHLQLERISKSAADQRTGRAGRTAPGICMRLWTRGQHRHLAKHDEPEIRRVDLAAPVLELLAWGEPDPLALRWFEPPSAQAIGSADTLLRMLGAVDEEGITEMGRRMARLPVHPRMARLMIDGSRTGHAAEAVLAAAILSERDVFERNPGGRSHHHAERLHRSGKHSSDSDVLDRVDALQEFETLQRAESLAGRINAGAARQVLRARDQLLRLMKEQLADSEPPGSADVDPEEAIARAIALAYLDRLARRRSPGSRQGVMVGGRGVRLAESSAVATEEFFVCVEIQETGGAEAIVHTASAVDPAWLPAAMLATSTDVEFNADRERVFAVRRVRFCDLVISEGITDLPNDVRAAQILAAEARDRLEVQTLLGSGGQQFLNRVATLAKLMPELNLPQWSESELESLLPDLCAGCTSFVELRSAPIVEVLKSKLSGLQLAALNREAPERVTVPSGRQIALDYQAGNPPVLAVRIQELFGLRDTPRIAGGRMAVVLHLLGPNYRPQQITTDLASFWRTTYSEVRKELRRRYPKHAWPEDPLAAQPESKPRRRKQ